MKTTILTLLIFIVAINVITAQNYPQMIKVTGGTLGDIGNGTITVIDYYIGKTEVTVAQYRTYCRATGVSMPEEPSWNWNDNDPIINVNWNDAINYCKWLSKKLGKKITLPTEAQWEFAARGGNKSKGYKYSGSNTLSTVGWYDDNSNSKAHEVAQKSPNELGLYDMSGNVWEWCSNRYDSMALHGGSWYSFAPNCRVAFQSIIIPVGRINPYGFRVVSF